MTGLLMMELAVGAAELILVGAAVFGVLYAIGFVAELCQGLVNVSTAVFVLFTIAGVLLYLDFRPSVKKKHRPNQTSFRRKDSAMSERKALRAYSAR